MSISTDDAHAAESKNLRPQFGGRLLTKEDDVFKHNAWDNVEWGEEQEQAALTAVATNSQVTLSPEQVTRLEEDAANNWDKFYNQHQNKFFKNRNWLFTEFPELAPQLADKLSVSINCSNANGVKNSLTCELEESSSPTEASGVDRITQLPECETNNKTTETCSEVESNYPGSSANFRVLEIGCGVGNTIFPLLQTNNDPKLFVYGGDFSPTAIDIIKQHAEYDTKRCNVFVLDVTSPDWCVPFPPNSLDAITCLYVFSAIHPDKHHHVARKLKEYLRPGGVLLFRDYGRYDLAQLRFKKGKCLADNFYVRGDGTRSYFFTQEDIRNMFVSTGLKEKQNIVDRRLQVNRGKQLTMYRVWVQAKYTKPASESI